MTTSPAAWRPKPETLVAAALILLAAFAIRGWQFGDPLIHVDENFYLLVGDRMLHGATPYVDIWDRKPVGLFLLFAAIRLLGGDGIVQYQVVATLFAAATGVVIARIAQPMAGRVGGVLAAIVYLLLIGLVGGSGGQAPVFYNLLMAGAALAVMRVVVDAEPRPAQITRAGALAMGLVGLALQIKYSVVFEGVFLGLALMWASWRASKSPSRTALDALAWIALALLPTALAWFWYAAHGQADAFVYANFLSIGARSGTPIGELLHRLLKTLRVLEIPLMATFLGMILQPWKRFAQGPASFHFVLAWLGAAVAGFLLFGTYFDHYALPLFVPLAAAAAPLFAYRRRHLGLVAAAVMLAAGGGAYAAVVHKMLLKRGGRAEMNAMVDAIRPRLTPGGEGLYVWNGDTILYHLTGATLPSRWPFAGHLNLLRENGAIGVDQAGEVRRIFATRPRVVVDHDPIARDFNLQVVALARAELARDYRPVKVVTFRHSRTIIYERIPGR
jgi:4-amino-4-deoxy-L-arabinose transferase-like glycosyltransferase